MNAGQGACRWVTAAAVAAYLAISIAYLDRFPVVGQDEPWIAAPAYKLATQGVLGSDLFAGYHGMDRHHFEHMPVYTVLEAAIFRLFGVGVVAMRSLSVAFGLALLVMMYGIGRETGGERVAALAVVLMVAVRLTAPTAVRPIGIVLLDDARINRYDIAVPAFGLAALWVTIYAVRRPRRALWVLTGILAGLSGLSHLYGVFWLPVLVAFLCNRNDAGRSTLRSIALVVAGFALIWLPWVVWVGLNWSDYLGQMRGVATRFEVLAPAFYIDNIVFGDGPISLRWLWRTVGSLAPHRAGAWALTIGAPVAVVLLWQRHGKRAVGETALLVACAVQIPLFFALLQVKSFSYVIAVWPLGALALAWLTFELWDRRGWVVRTVLVVVGAAIAIESGAHLKGAAEEARSTSSYDGYEQQIADCIPDGSLVLGFQHYWLGLRRFPYRSWLMAFNQANPDIERDPVPLDVALDRINPDVILIDRYARQLFSETADPSNRYHHLSVGFDAFRARRRLSPRCTVRDASYGTMEIYDVNDR